MAGRTTSLSMPEGSGAVSGTSPLTVGSKDSEGDLMSTPANTTATIVPTFRYRDAAKAIDWLCDAFGFERQFVMANDDGTIGHAQLTFGNGMIMVGSSTVESEYGKLLKTPSELGGFNTQGPYVVVADADTHYARAKAAGAEIVLELVTQDYGGRDYTCRDLEGHVWTFGTYDPWATQGS